MISVRLMLGRGTPPLVWGAFRASLLASLLLAAVALAAGSIRLLPWLLDPSVPFRIAAPFAKGLASIGLEAAIVVGWPVGCALAMAAHAEKGETRVLQLLGERPLRTLLRLLPQGLLFGVFLGISAVIWGADANLPGVVVNELVTQGERACRASDIERSYAIPFTDLSWLCAPGHEPRIVGTAPGALSRARFSAQSVTVAGDLRGIHLTDARLVLPSAELSVPIRLHVGTLSARGLTPWAHASTLPLLLRVFVMWASAFLSTGAAALALLKRPMGRVAAIVVGSAGPLVALATTRALERSDARSLAFLSAPAVAALTAALVALLATRLPALRLAATTLWRKQG